jgi:hypothetical protein
MSIDLNWETLTSGPDGEALAERIRLFVHDKFQTVALPRFIKSVAVHGFDFGSVPPQLELKDITDPLPDFYEEDLDDEEESEDDDGEATLAGSMHERDRGVGLGPRPKGLRTDTLRGEFGGYDLGSPFLGTSTPGILGGPGLNSYFQGHLGTGTHTPLAAVAGAHLSHNWLHNLPEHGISPSQGSHSRNPSQSSISVSSFTGATQPLREKSSVSTLAPTSANTSRPPTRDTHFGESAIEEEDDEEDEDEDAAHARPRREPRVEDVQAVFRIRYSGDIRLNLTAEILLDYPMPSFVGIPLKLNITGLSFDGVGVTAHIRKRVHFCFLSPEDAMTAVGPDEDDHEDDEPGVHGVDGDSHRHKDHKAKFGGLLQEIKVESEIGGKDGGKQSLKNVGKVERFVLEQVRRIFEEEFVYPSFWTFLV